MTKRPWVDRYLRAKYKTLSVRIRKDKLDKFKKKCIDSGISQSHFINACVTKFITDEEK